MNGQAKSVWKCNRRIAWARLWIGVLALFVLAGCVEESHASEVSQVAYAGDPEVGRIAIEVYGCGSCHTIPGVPGANSLVGPPLNAWADRQYIAGTLTNEPANLISWIQYPQAIEPGTAMPNMGVTEDDAEDIAAYLYTLRRDLTWHARVRGFLGLESNRNLTE